MGMFISGSSTSTGSFGDGRIAGKLGIQISGTPRGPIDVKGSAGSQGFYLSNAGTAAYLPTDIAHSSGATTFDFKVNNLRLGKGAAFGAVNVYPRFSSQLNLGNQDDTDLLVLSGSTKISGSAQSTGSFGRLVVGRGSTDSSYASSAGGNVIFGVNGGQSTDRIILQGNTVEIGNTDYFAGNVFTKGSVNGFTADPSLFIQKGLQIMGGGNNRGISINAGNADKKTFIVAQAGGMDLHDFYIANARAGRRIKMQVVSGSTLTDTLTLTTGSDSNIMVELGGNISGSAQSTGSFGRVEAAGDINLKSTDNALTFTTGSQELSLSLYKAPGTSGMNHSALMLGGAKVFEPRTGNNSYFYSFNSLNFRNDETASTGNARFIFGDAADAPHQEVQVSVGWASLRSTKGSRKAEINGYWGTVFTKQGAQDDNAPYIQFGLANNTNLDAYFYSGSIFVTGEGSSGDIVVQGTNAKISGSSTSTGSFGHGYIDSRLGIGTKSPERELEVVGQDAKIKIMSERHNTATGTTNHFTTLGYDSSGARPFILSNQSNTPILFKNNAGSIPLAIHTNQYVGVNNTSPGYRLDVLHNGDEQFRVGRSGAKYVAIRDDVMQFTGMTGNGMRIQTSDNSDIKFSAGTGDIIFDYADSGGRVISYADIRVHGNIIAENYIVSSSVTHMTQSFSSGSTIFGDTGDDTHQFTGSLTVQSGSMQVHSIGKSSQALKLTGQNGQVSIGMVPSDGTTGTSIVGINTLLSLRPNGVSVLNIKNSGYVGINVTAPQAPLHVENGTNGHAVIRLEDARTGDDSITAGGRLDFHSNHIQANKTLGQIIYEQEGPNHQQVRFQIKGTLAGVGGKVLVKNDDNGRWRFYNNYTEDLALEIKNQKLGVGGITNPTETVHVSGSILVEPDNSDLTDNSALGLYVKGLNGGIKIGRHSGNDGAYTHLYTDIVSRDFLHVKNNGANNGGIATDRIGSITQNTMNNHIHFDGFNKKYYGYHEGASTPYEQHDADGISIMLNADHTFKVSGSLIQFTPTEKVNVTGNIVASGDITGSAGLSIHDIIGTGKIVLTADALNDGLYVRRNNSTNALAHFSNRFGNGEVRTNLKLDNTSLDNGTGNRLDFTFSSARFISITGRKETSSYGGTSALIIKHHRSHVQPDGIGFARFSMLKVSEALGGATGYTGTGAAAAAPSFFVSTGSIYVETGNVSGSSTSTGSFGLSKIQSSTISSESDIMYFKPDGVTSRMSLSSQGPSVSNIYTPSIVAAGGESLNIIASGVFLNLGADYDSTYGNIDIYPTGKNIGTPKTARFNPNATFFYKSLDITGHVTASGDISGSATSTGSFGQIEFETGNEAVSINGDSRGIIVGQYGNSSKQGVFTVFGSYAGSILGLATDNNQWVFSPYDNTGLEFKGGSSGTKFRFRPGGGASKRFEITADGDVSGSATSTGSFGSLVVAGRVQGDTTFNDDIFLPNGDGSKISFPGGGTHEIYRPTGGYYIKYIANLGHAFTSAGNDTFGGGQGTVYIRRNSTNHSIETTMSDFKFIAGSGTGGFGFRTVGSDYEYTAIKSFKTGADQGLIFQTRTHSTSTHTERLRIDTSGHLLPGADNTSNLGSASKRWANIHSADLHLSNEDTEGNEVDGTTGNWTIQEGEDDLFLLNRKNGKKYRFKLEEIT